MLIWPIVELRIIRTLSDYLKELESSEPFPVECVKKVAHRVFGLSRSRLRERVNCYIMNHRKILVEKIRAGDITTIPVNSHVDWDEKRVAACQRETRNNLKEVNSLATKSCVRHRQPGWRAKLRALSRRQSNQRMNMNDSTIKAKTITSENAESNNKDGKKDASIDLTELSEDRTQFLDVPSTRSRQSDSFPPESQSSGQSGITLYSSDGPFLGFSKDVINDAPPKYEAFCKILDDMCQQPPRALITSSHETITGPTKELGHNNIHDDILLLNASDCELPKEETCHMEYMVPDDFAQPPPPALTPSSSGLITPISEEMSHDSGDGILMTSFEIPKDEACYAGYILPDTSFQLKHTVMSNATNQARKAKLYSELANLVQRTQHAEIEISRWENIRLQLRAQQRNKEQELKGLLQQEQQEDS